MNKVLNRPMFRREALRKGHLKPIKANTGIFTGGQIGPPAVSMKRHGGGPIIPSGTVGPFPKIFAYNPREGSYLTQYGANQLRRFPGRFAAPLMMYGTMEAAGVPTPVTSGVLGAELTGLAAGLFGKRGRFVSRILTSPSRLAISNPALAATGLATVSTGRGFYDMKKEKELVREYAKANNIDPERAINIYERDRAGEGERSFKDFTFSDIAKNINLLLSQSPSRVRELVKPPSTDAKGSPSEQSEAMIANDIRAYTQYVGKGGARVYQDIDSLVKNVKKLDAAQLAEDSEFRGPDDQMIFDSQATQTEKDLVVAQNDLTAKIMFETGEQNVAKAANIAKAVLNGEIEANDVKKVAVNDDMYAKVSNVSGDATHPNEVKKLSLGAKGADDSAIVTLDGSGKPTVTKKNNSGDPDIDAGKDIASEYNFDLKDLDPRKTATDPKLVFLTKLAAGLLSGKTMEGGFKGFAEILGTALGPAVDASILVKMKNDENFRDFATMVIDFNKEKLKEDNDVLGSGKFFTGSIEIDGEFIEGFQDKETGVVYTRQGGQVYTISPEQGQFYKQQDSTKYMDNIKLVADGALSEKIIKEQIALLRSPGGRTASGASGIILKTVETFGNLPGEIIDGFRGGISQDFSQTGVTEEFSKRTNKALQALEKKLQKTIDDEIEAAQKAGQSDTASQTLGKLQVNARMLTYTLANSLKEKDRLTNRDLQLIEELTKTLGLEPDEKIIQRYEELLKRVQQKQKLRLNKFYTMGNTYRDVQGILKNLGTEAIIESTTPEIFTTENAFEALGIN